MKIIFLLYIIFLLELGQMKAFAQEISYIPYDGSAVKEWMNSENLSALNSSDKTGTDVDRLIPQRREGVSMTKVIALDLLIPGGGHFYRGDYFAGGAFLLLKGAGYYSIWYFYQEWEYRRSLYLSAKRANESIDPNHELSFRDPDGHYKTVTDFKHDYDRAAIHFTFAILVNIGIYLISVAVNFSAVSEINEKAIPAFEVYYSGMPFEGGEKTFGIKYTYRI